MVTRIEPDTKDWTWVLDRPCPECGFDAGTVPVAEVGARIRENAAVWAAALTAPDAHRRPAAGVWSVVEYAAHVRDVHGVFAGRLASMLAEDEPRFANWDQDAAALDGRYDLAVAYEAAKALGERAEAVAARYDAVKPDQHERRGHRSNGSVFTVETLARYHLHDVVHHLWDVRRSVTLAAYDAHATDYREASAPVTDAVRAALDDLAGRLAPGARVLEIGSAGGRDARELEARGLSVRRTDVTPGFVRLLREAGHEADVLDPLTDDLSDPARPDAPYDAVWASASLLHVDRADLPVVLGRLAVATRPGGVLRASVKEGDGEAWSTHGSVTAPRRFTFWRGPALEAALTDAGWRVEHVGRADGSRGERWLSVVAYR